jgi:hypothetical protein
MIFDRFIASHPSNQIVTSRIFSLALILSQIAWWSEKSPEKKMLATHASRSAKTMFYSS